MSFIKLSLIAFLNVSSPEAEPIAQSGWDLFKVETGRRLSESLSGPKTIGIGIEAGYGFLILPIPPIIGPPVVAGQAIGLGLRCQTRYLKFALDCSGIASSVSEDPLVRGGLSAHYLILSDSNNHQYRIGFGGFYNHWLKGEDWTKDFWTTRFNIGADADLLGLSFELNFGWDYLHPLIPILDPLSFLGIPVWAYQPTT